jgi:hypothetical protein
MRTSIPIRIVREDGRVERLGEWAAGQRTLRLERAGFPFLGPGEHQIEGDLPWVFWDMTPSGFLGQVVQRSHPELGLQPNPALWSPDAALRVLTRLGEDLAGNLLIGDESFERWQGWTFQPTNLARQIESVMSAELGGARTISSLGGDRPKVLATRPNGTATLIKFSPNRSSKFGARWSDLLRMEALCSRVIQKNGIRAAKSVATASAGRMTLHVERFDRLKGRGRVGAATLYWLAMDRYGEADTSALEVLRRLAADQLLPTEDVESAELLQRFSEAIGNTDTHLGNYGLVFNEQGQARLAPAYDVLPMAFAPRHDELPDRELKPRAQPIDERVLPWVQQLVTEVGRDQEITAAFKKAWRRHIGASARA